MPPRVKKTEQNLTEKKNITRKNKNVESLKELDGVPLESVSEPVITQAESVLEPPVEPVLEPLVKPVLEPPVEPVPEPHSESVPEPPSESVLDPLVEPVPEPRSEPVPEPPSESVSEVAGVFCKLQQPSVSPAAPSRDGDIQALLEAAETVPEPSVEHPFEPQS